MGIELDPDTWRGLEYLESISGPGAIAELVQSYLRDAPGRLERMRSALEAGDREALNRQAHDLKSNSATIGAIDLSVLSARIERGAADGDLTELRAWTESAASMLGEVFAALEERVRQYPG